MVNYSEQYKIDWSSAGDLHVNGVNVNDKQYNAGNVDTEAYAEYVYENKNSYYLVSDAHYEYYVDVVTGQVSRFYIP